MGQLVPQTDLMSRLQVPAIPCQLEGQQCDTFLPARGATMRYFSTNSKPFETFLSTPCQFPANSRGNNAILFYQLEGQQCDTFLPTRWTEAFDSWRLLPAGLRWPNVQGDLPALHLQVTSRCWLRFLVSNFCSWYLPPKYFWLSLCRCYNKKLNIHSPPIIHPFFILPEKQIGRAHVWTPVT